MGRYINFLFSVTLRKKGLYIVFATLIAIFSGMMYVSTREANNEFRQGLFPVSTFLSWIPFIFTTIFSGLLILRIFKTGEQDGTELLISAKPITRKQLILGKFFVLITMIMAFHVLLFLSYFGLSFLDKYATTDEKLRYAASIAFGGMIVSIIITSIITILTSALGKVGTMVISILISALVPVVSFILVPTSKAIAPSFIEKEAKYFRGLHTSAAPDVYKIDDNGKAKTEIIKPSASNSAVDVIDANHDSWYKYAKYGDIWYQWGRFFSMFKGSKQYHKSVLGMTAKHASYDKLSLEEIYNRLYKLKDQAVKRFGNNGALQKTELLLLTKEQVEFEKRLSGLIDPKIFKISDLTGTDKTKNLEAIFDELIKVITSDKGKLTKMLKPISVRGIPGYSKEFYTWRQTELNKITNKFFGSAGNLIFWEDMKLILWRLIAKFQKENPSDTRDFLRIYERKIRDIGGGKPGAGLPAQTEFFLDVSDNWNVLDVTGKVYDKTGKMKTVNLLDDKDEFIKKYLSPASEKIIMNYKEEDHLSTTLVVLMWTAIAIGLVSASIFTYMRRDFK